MQSSEATTINWGMWCAQANRPAGYRPTKQVRSIMQNTVYSEQDAAKIKAYNQKRVSQEAKVRNAARIAVEEARENRELAVQCDPLASYSDVEGMV